jgi:uncharacterized SAM-binding protein YcdF (DUF218 family)
MSVDTKFQNYDSSKLYDIILLLAGENTQSYPRSSKALEIYSKGKTGGIFITGGYGGFATQPLGMTDGMRSLLYLIKTNIMEGHLYIDEMSRETLGNFALPAGRPIIGNPILNELESILVVTEEEHMPRTLAYAEKVIPAKKLSYACASGHYRADLTTRIYNAAMLHALMFIREPNPEAALAFL